MHRPLQHSAPNAVALFTFSILIVVTVVVTLAGCNSGSSTGGTLPATQSQSSGPAGVNANIIAQSGKTVAEIHHWVPRYTTIPLRGVDLASLDAQRATAMTIPFYKGSVKSPLDGKRYIYRIVGQDPQTSDSTTDIPYVPIVMRITFPDGTVLDPTKPSCGDTVPVETRFFKGPNFVPTDIISNGVDVGVTQVNDAFQRAEFWTILNGPNYHTVLKPAVTPIVVDVKAPRDATTVPGSCSDTKHVSHRVGRIDATEYYKIVFPLINKYALPSQAALAFMYNVVLSYPSGCCTLGFHTAYRRAKDNGTQTGAVAAYLDHGIFFGVGDIAVWTHEIGELFNDPFVNNATPAWGHIGQVAGCQSNLEVGDPLSGRSFLLTFKGFAYHPQELAFFSWFFRTPSTGTSGLFSFEGTFKSSQGACNS